MQQNKLMKVAADFNDLVSRIFQKWGSNNSSKDTKTGSPEYWKESALALIPLANISYIAVLVTTLIIMFLSLPLYLIAIISAPMVFINLVFRRYINYFKMGSDYIEPTQRDVVYGVILSTLTAIVAWLIISMLMNRFI